MNVAPLRGNACRLTIATLLLSSLAGCGAVTLDDVASVTPRFVFEDYFEGHTRASGWFASRSGTPKRHFCGDFIGTRGDAAFELDETLIYTDGVVETRLWNVVSDGRAFTATGEALVGAVDGQIEGNALRMQYTMKVTVTQGEDPVQLDFNDFMLLQPDGSLHNATMVKKFGVRLGTVSTQYVHHDGSETCAVMQERLASNG